ncbi:MAG: GNAT family N-acetyltransferase [Thermoanaerobaculum sp.]
MAKIKVLPTSRVGIGPLAEMAEHMRALLPGWEDTRPASEKAARESDLRADLEHLAHHDADGVLVASLESEVVGFVASFVRSRWLVVSQLWVLPDYLDAGAAEVLLRRALLFGQRSGTTRAGLQALAPWQLALGLQFGLSPSYPMLRLVFPAEKAVHLGHQLLRLQPGTEVTVEAAGRHAYFADLERLDRLVRGFARTLDHEYWLFSRNLRLAVIREGERIVAYAYGGSGQCGPVVAATEEAALAAVGWALQFAASASDKGEAPPVSLLVPATFTRAFDHLLAAKPQVPATTFWLANENPRAGYFIAASFSLL